MKAILIFNRPEDEKDLEVALKAQDLKGVIEDFDDSLRSKSKYEDVENISIQEVRDLLWKIVEENNCKDLFV